MMTYKYNLDNVQKTLNELSSYREKNKALFFKEIGHHSHVLVMLSNNYIQLFFQSLTINSDDISTGTIEVVIGYEPTSKLSNFLTALRAKDW